MHALPRTFMMGSSSCTPAFFMPSRNAMRAAICRWGRRAEQEKGHEKAVSGHEGQQVGWQDNTGPAATVPGPGPVVAG